MDRYLPTNQRAALRKLVTSLGARLQSIKTDEYGAPFLEGKAGRVIAICGTVTRPKTKGFHLFVSCEGHPRAWASAKRTLGFAEVDVEGDEEGFLFLDHLPNGDEAAAIRKVLGITKRRVVSAETLARLRLQSPITKAGGFRGEKVASNVAEAVE